MPLTTHEAKRAVKLLFRWCLVDGKLDERRGRQVVKVVLQSRRRGYLTVLGEFKRLVKLERARHTARIESAAPLPMRNESSRLELRGQAMNVDQGRAMRLRPSECVAPWMLPVILQ